MGNLVIPIGKHFALLGSTGVGKSSGVAVLLRAILEVRPNLRIFLIDPHNEYGHSFRERAQILTPKNLKLPFWLFNFEETVDVFFRGRRGLEDEVEILAQLIPQAKNQFAAARGAESQTLRKVDSSQTGHTVDTPVPYRLSDLVNLIDERMGKLENRSSTSKFSRLVARIETVRQDPRYAFMFDNANGAATRWPRSLASCSACPPTASRCDATGRLPLRGGGLRRLRARAHGLRHCPRAVATHRLGRSPIRP